QILPQPNYLKWFTKLGRQNGQRPWIQIGQQQRSLLCRENLTNGTDIARRRFDDIMLATLCAKRTVYAPLAKDDWI
ncbi:hypothetical protein, partial [Vibrio furnissii]|uniref:hypothetical protein n=1 Tax=Vibrio furnissii TaxID=29494 RepID=UPI001EEAE61F|nr:hypothetical protein [Vibrio furnissii]